MGVNARGRVQCTWAEAVATCMQVTSENGSGRGEEIKQQLCSLHSWATWKLYGRFNFARSAAAAAEQVSRAVPRMATCAVEQLRKERLHTSASPTCLHRISNGSRRPTRISQSRQVSTLVELASLLKQLPCLPHGVPTRALSSRQRSVSCFNKVNTSKRRKQQHGICWRKQDWLARASPESWMVFSWLAAWRKDRRAPNLTSTREPALAQRSEHLQRREFEAHAVNEQEATTPYFRLECSSSSTTHVAYFRLAMFQRQRDQNLCSVLVRSFQRM